MPDYSPTIPPDYVIDQSFGIDGINGLLDNDANLWAALDVEHDKRTGRHQGLAFPIAFALVRFEPARLPIAVTGDADTTAASTTVTSDAVGADFTAYQPGWILRVPVTGEEHSIARINSATSLDTDAVWDTSGTNQTYEVYRPHREDRYYFDEMSFGFVGEPLRQGKGIVILTLACAAAQHATYTTRKRIALVSHYRADWNDEGPAFTPAWQSAGADAGGLFDIGKASDVGERLVIQLRYTDGTNLTGHDHPFAVAVFVDGAN